MSYRSMIYSFLIYLIIGYLGIIAFAYFTQNSMVFFPRKLSEKEAYSVGEKPNLESIRLKVERNTEIHGWIRDADRINHLPIILYFGGNAEEISHVFSAPQYEGYPLVAFNYRGYGLSEGKPSEKTLKNDARSIYRMLVDDLGVRPERIVVSGSSIGSGLAVYLASVERVHSLILITPMDSLVEVGARHFPYLPVRLLLRTRFDSISLARNITTPAQFIIAENDAIIPPSHAWNLYESWEGPKEADVIRGCGHNDIHLSAKYIKVIKNRLKQISD